MAPRAQWNGYLRLSLVSCAVSLYPAISPAERVSFRQVNRETGNRLRQQLVDTVTGKVVESRNRGRGYQVGEDQFLVVPDEELKEAQLEARSRPFTRSMPTTEDEDAAPAALQPLGKQPKGGRRKTEVDEPEPEAEEAEPEAKETERAPVPRPIIENTHTIERKLEAELDEAWSRDLPFLLADLLDIVAAAIANSGNVRFAVEAGMVPPLPRLADAAIAAEAAAQAEGWEPGLLLRVLNATRDTAKADQLEANPVAVRVRKLLDASAGHWTGTMTELLEKLKVEEGPPWGREVFSVHVLAKALDRIVASLPVWGIEVTRGDRSKTARTLTISRAAAAQPAEDARAG